MPSVQAVRRVEEGVGGTEHGAWEPCSSQGTTEPAWAGTNFRILETWAHYSGSEQGLGMDPNGLLSGETWSPLHFGLCKPKKHLEKRKAGLAFLASVEACP